MFDIKSKWKMILALGAVALFIFEIIALGVIGGGGGGGGTSGGTVQTGTAEFTGIIRTYDPVLLVTDGLDEDAAAELREMEGVKDLNPVQEGTLINTETRDDVYPIAVYLREKSITSYSVANIAMPSVIEVMLGNGSLVNVSAGNIAVRVYTEPIVDVDTEVRISMLAQVVNGMLSGYGSALLVTEDVEVEAASTVLEAKYIHTYLVPWDERNDVDIEELPGEVEYDKNDFVYFGQPISVEEVLEKKNLSYVEYIDQYGIECSSGFNDADRVENDFENVTFPDSVLTVITNETVDLHYDGTTVYRYRLSLPQEAEGMLLEQNETELESEEFYEEDSEVGLKISGIAIGNRIVTIKSVKFS